ncbi:tyrosine-protein phosphatase [Nocardioides fonticola]|uniref:Tyrosine-protein phosphatase n=1 Tax=Nocardioides fonticola TaxID=450363 RepID=A0ABP7XQ12_9ACTN
MSPPPVDPAETQDLRTEMLRLSSADNFRDVAGDGYLTEDGVRLLTGVLFRSNELQLSHGDAATVAGLGVTDVFDLRESIEVEAHPDIEVPGSRWHHVPVEGIPMTEVADLPSLEAALDTMHRVYRGFVELAGARAAFAELFRSIAASSTPQLFHCTAGKDRTGWAAAVLLRLCGVPEATVHADYLLTNEVDGTRHKYLGLIREHLGEDKVAVYEAVMVADLAYLAEADAAVAEHHGSLEAYVRDGLGLSDAEIAALVGRLRPA